MKKALLVLVWSILSASAVMAGEFPTRPDPQLTPGSLCDKPNSKRYPEGVPYCTRSVGSSLKDQVMRTYDERLDYQVTSMDRSAFKIDHYIPLCAGGSNHSNNLWPQHKSVYAITDPLEPLICEKMAKGTLRQADAVVFIRRAKANLSEVNSIIRQIQAL